MQSEREYYVKDEMNLACLFQDITQKEQEGVKITLQDHVASPMQIVKAHRVKENSSLMRDYVFDDKGDVKELHFHIVNL